MLDVLDLVSYSDTQDAIGAHHAAAPQMRRVFCRTDGIRRSEWAAAGASGHKPELVATIPAADYAGEQEAVYRGQSYSIYRTYPAGDWEVELYLEAKAGVRYGS